jgi:hypothetical protein
MTNQFRIAFEPILREHGSELERATLAAVTLWVGDQTASRLMDTLAHTVRDSTRVSILRLAQWFAENWWRLRWEPERQPPSPSWRMSHELAAAGGGYLWPPATFSSDGDSMRVRTKSTPWHSQDHVHYLEDIDTAIPIAAFERSVDEFVDGVLARVASLGLDAGDLQAAWRIVQSERTNPAETGVRKLEALLGYDPEEAPEDLLATLRQSEGEFGADSIGEVAAASGPDQVLPDLEAFRGHPERLGIPVTLPDLDTLKRYLHGLPATDTPWQRAEKLAVRARETWSMGEGPVTNDGLFDLLASNRVLDEQAVPFAAGLRSPEHPERFAVSCRARFPSGRRFELVRLIADQIAAGQADRLLPATLAKTGRQKFQRAFASEFLCPYQEIKAELGDTPPNDEDIDVIADRYGVSPLLVRTSLVNKGDLSRDTLPA